jgi:hypothetical protein
MKSGMASNNGESHRKWRRGSSIMNRENEKRNENNNEKQWQYNISGGENLAKWHNEMKAYGGK